MKNRLRLLLPLVVLALLVLFGRQIAWFITDWSWFAAVGFGPIFVKVLATRVLVGAAVALVAFGILWGNVAWVLRTPAVVKPKPQPLHVVGEDKPSGPETIVQLLQSERLPRRLAAPVAAVVGIVLGLGASAWWKDALLLLNGGPVGWTEPVLGHDAGFYLFSLPLLMEARSLLGFVLFLTFAVTVGLYLARGGLQVKVVQKEGQVQLGGLSVAPVVRSHLGGLGGAMLLVMAVGTYLQRYAVLYSQEGLISGPGFTEVNLTLPLLLVQALLTVGAAGLVFPAARSMSRGLGSLAVLLLALGWALTAAVPYVVQRFVVLPNELDRETEYIENHVEATRLAWGLDVIEERFLSGEAELTAADIGNNQGTIQNVRLWDHEPLLDTFSQVQEIRTYYEFVSVDNDRYMIDGQLRQIMLSPRELDVAGLPERARTWVNESLVYTHGYGLSLGPVNQVTEEGLPELFVKDLPPQVLYEDVLGIVRPELYYGESMTTPVFVRTHADEFDYPAGEGNAYTTYAGKGGAPVNSLLWQFLYSLRFQSTKVLFTGDIGPETRVLLYRPVIERAQTIAPFLAFDRDPYLVIVDGRLVWIVDAYTTSRRFPYSQAAGKVGNYLRNSVKITIDAYDGTITFYEVDPGDPVLQAWKSAFPSLLTPGEQMPEEIRAHLRYPQDLFNFQTHLFATYHMTDPQMFYNREDEWEVPAPNGVQMAPYYTIMKLPGGGAEEFIVMLPFVPRDKPNLAAWMVARSDGEAYGELVAYKFPKDKMIYGPNMIVARIDQDANISEKLSLWNQQGSRARRGTLLVIPIEESLIYIQPLYLEAESASIPELKRVIVGYQNQIAMEPTLDQALAAIFGEEAPEVVRPDGEPTAPEGEPSAGEPAGTQALAGSWEALVAEAATHYAAAQEAMRAGDWAGYGQALDALGASLDALEAGTTPAVEDEAPEAQE